MLFANYNLEEAVKKLSASDNKSRGAIFTRNEVVEFILDAIGYTVSTDLSKYSLLEPSFGDGDFLLIALDRLLESAEINKTELTFNQLKNSIRAVEVGSESFHNTHKLVIEKLIKFGINKKESIEIADAWLINGDYLLTNFDINFTYIVGNPPYVRQEQIPKILLDEYRRLYSTIYDRADLYIPFIEKSLKLLKDKAILGFICSDRWIKNKYGGPLRQLVSDSYNLKYYIDIVGTNAFNSEVLAYPSIIVINRQKSSSTLVAENTVINKQNLDTILSEFSTSKKRNLVREVKNILNGSDPWMIYDDKTKSIISKIEDFPQLNDAGVNVGIGVATGSDKVYITKNSIDIEEDRKMPVALTKNIENNRVKAGSIVVNPFDDNGNLVNLDDYPKLKKYFLSHEAVLKNRHVAKKNPKNWYKTIDKISVALLKKEKLLIPDIKNKSLIVYDQGEYYPHHNFYYLTSDTWPLIALNKILSSSILDYFISIYSVKMRGNYFRFQAQYLRKFRVPYWNKLTEDEQSFLLSSNYDKKIIDNFVLSLYKLTKEEIETLLNKSI